MRFSYWPSADQPWAGLLASCRHVEAAGWDGIWYADHFMPNTPDAEGPIHECWTTIAALAAQVPRVRLGPLVTGNTYRHPAVLAKMAVTVDGISGGRLVLGLGAGWQENEHRAYGLHFGTTGERLDRLAEACSVVSALFGRERPSYEGRHYTLQDAPFEPAARRDLQLLIGGGGEQRTLRIAARYAAEWNIWGTPARLAEKGAVLDARCAEIDRDPAEIERSAVALLYLSDDEAWLGRYRGREVGRPTIVGTPSEVREVIASYRDAGVDEIIVPDFNLRDVNRRHDVLDQFITEVASEFA